MERLRAKFEQDLRAKLQQRCTSHMSEETFLMRAFRFFDVDNSRSVSRQEWVRAIEKAGVLVEDESQLQSLFNSYDLDGSGYLDYEEFVAAVFGAESGVRKRLSPQKALNPSQQQQAEQVMIGIRDRLVARGTRGLIGLSRQFKIMDDNDSGFLEVSEFNKALRDYRIQITEEEAELVFNYIDRDHSGSIDYDEFLRVLRGPLNPFRRGLVAKAFSKLDVDNSGEVDLADIRNFYDASQHPDVRSGKKTEDEVLNEFLDTFEVHHSFSGGSRNRRVTYEEFEEYYTNVSASIDNDQYFELMMNNAWKLSEPPAYSGKPAWASAPEPPRRAAKPLTREVDGLLQKFRSKLASRGARGILGLSRQFKIMDDDNSRTISLAEFKKACKDFRVGVEDHEIERIFHGVDLDRSGVLDYDELLRAIRGPMNSFRLGLVSQAWNKLDRDRNGVLELDDIRGVYNAKQHPEVQAGRKTEDDVLGEFLETFEMHHNIASPDARDRRVTREEFNEYYNNVSASIDDDRYFETMMTNAWRLRGEPPAREAWAGQFFDQEASSKASWLVDHHRSHFGGSVSSSAPFGTSDEPVDYSTALRPARRQGEDLLSLAQNIQPAGISSWPVQSRGGPSAPPVEPAPEHLIKMFKEKIAARGARGFVGLSRQFKIMDDNNNKSLDLNEFLKGLRDFRVDMKEEDARKLFNYFDANRTGAIDYEEFVHRIRGGLNENRKKLVSEAFRKIDRTGDGVLNLDDIKGLYNVSSHPEVRMGKKTEDEVLCEFLDTFEVHHSMYKDGSRDANVTLDEFSEYYAHISASIDDDRYFELMIRNAWNFDNKTYQKGWRGDY